LRLLFLYDCLYPHTIGGFERYYREVVIRLARKHQVTYLTRVQWDNHEKPDVPDGVKLIALECGRDLYTSDGRRRIAPPLRFALGVFAHLVRNRSSYDVVQTCSFPYFPMLSCAIVRSLGGPPMVTDWIEVWSRDYWLRYLGPLSGRMGLATQNLCVRVTRDAFTLSELARDRLAAMGLRQRAVVLRGLSTTAITTPDENPRPPLFIYAGRHTVEKRVDRIPAAIALAREKISNLRARIFGDGPERKRVLAEIARLRMEDIIECPGFVSSSRLEASLGEACGFVLPSEREGYGAVVVEAAARGTPSIVVREPENAATELILEGVNGFIASSCEAPALAEQMVKVHLAGSELRARTHRWYVDHAEELSIDSSIAQIEQVYRRLASG
jgi:glycosyltransferase involved in cell wall biosynthesis